MLIKAVCGCNGYNADKLVQSICEQKPETPQAVYDLAIQNGFGCKNGLVVMGNSEVIARDKELSPLYREKFNDPEFNPRWSRGTAAYVSVIERGG